MIFPLFVTLILLYYNWQFNLIFIGSAGLLFFIILIGIYRSGTTKSVHTLKQSLKSGPKWGIRNLPVFGVLSLIGIIDAITRTVLLTFIPFLFLQKGIPGEKTGIFLTVLLTGGAAGKLGCGLLADRIGNFKMILLTELFTALFIIVLFYSSHQFLLPLLLFCGFMLNGTSTVLYTAVAELVTPEGRNRGYGLFYTIYLIAESIGPAVFGIIGDRWGLRAIFFTLAYSTLIIIPLAFFLKKVK